MKTKRLLLALTFGLGLTLASLWLIATPLRAAPATPADTCTVDDSGGADYLTIQDAVNDATCTTINVAIGYYEENIVITRSLTLAGAGADDVEIGFTGQVFLIEDEDAEVSISGVRIEGVFDTVNGTGVYNAGTLTLTNVLITGNESNDSGGGIYNAGNLMFISSTASGNYAYMGGGIYNAGMMTILSSTVYGNLAYYGGGIFNNPASSSDELVVVNSTISGNEASNYGGGVFNYGNRSISFENGAIVENEALYRGGGLYNAGYLTLNNCQVLSNTASDASYTGNGAGIWNSGQAWVSDSLVQGNSAIAFGGGIYAEGNGELWLDNSTVSGNSAGYAGGGIMGYMTSGNKPYITIANSEVSGNTAASGGGILNSGEMTITTSTVSDNTASNGDGGGFWCSDALTITASTISGNTATGEGGGIYADLGAVLTLVNVTLSGNETNDDGGGIYFYGSSADLDSVTIAENIADADADGSGNGGGFYNDYPLVVTVQNTIIASNEDSSTSSKYPDCYGSFTSGGYNLIRNSVGCTGFTAASDLYGSSLAPLEPYLRPLGDYGGPTLLHALQYGKTNYSPAVDAGATSGCPSTDQRGMLRPYDGDGDSNAVCDIGAYEYGASLATPDLEIVKTVSPSLAAPGARITYTLVFSNTGNEAATGVVITDSIPVSVTNTSVASSGAALTTVSGTRYVWQVEDLMPGAQGLITITGLLQTPLITGIFTNTATLGADDDDDWSNNSASIGVMVEDAPPVASDATFYTDEDTPVEGALEASEPNGQSLYYDIENPPDYGTVSIAIDGIFVYTPTNRTANYSDTFDYMARTYDPDLCLGTCDDDTGKVTLFITATNDTPDISNIANQRTGVGVTVGPLAFIVADPDTLAGTLTLDKASSNTTLVPLSNITFGGSGVNRTVTVTPTTGLSGEVLITVTVSDGNSSAYDVFTLIVGTANTPPDFTSTPIRQATEDVAYTYAITTTDLDAGDVLTITAPTRPAWLTLTQITTRTATLNGTPINANVGSHAVTLQVVDNAGAANTQAFTITVRNVNDPPIARDNTPSTNEDTPLNIAVLVNDSDVDNDPLSIVAKGAPNYGNVTISRTTGVSDSVVYTPTNRTADYNAVFTYTISDGRLRDTATVTVAVTANNDAPTISNVADQSTYMGLRVGPLPFIVSDVDLPAGSLTLDKGSSNTTLVPLSNITFGGGGPNRTVTVTPTTGLSGAALITVTVSDGSNSAYDTFLLTVEGNSPPAFASTPSTAATQDMAYTYAITTTDVNAWDALTITAVTKPGWLALVDHHDRTATLSGTPANAHVGNHPVTLQVRDSHDATVTQSFTITVANVNDPPNARDDNAATDELTSVSVSVLSNDSDLDGDTVLLTSVGTPNMGSVSINGSAIVYTPTNRNADYNAVFTYTISDDALSDTGSVLVSVTAPDDPPFISNILNQHTNSGVPIGPLPFTVGDPDTPVGMLMLQKASSNIGLVPLPNITFGGSGANRTVTITPTAGTGAATITITVRDGTSSRRDAFVLTVGALNSPPDFTSTPVTTAAVGVAYTYAIIATDLDAGDALTITAPTRPAWLTLMQITSRTATLNGTSASAGDYPVVLQVQDNAGAIGTQFFTITVGSLPNQSPVANAGADQAVTINTLVTLNGGGSNDPDGNLPLVYSWTQTGGSPPVVLSNATISQPTFTAPGSATVLTFTLIVTDSLGLGAVPDTVVVTVSGTSNQPPFANAGDNQAVKTGMPVTLNGSGSIDPDGHPLTYGWTQAGGLLVSLSSYSAISPTFTAPRSATIITFTLVVTDSLGLASVPDTVVVAVTEYRIYLPLVKRN